MLRMKRLAFFLISSSFNFESMMTFLTFLKAEIDEISI